MKQFDLKAAKAGYPVCTRNGKKVRILAFDLKCREPLVVAIQEDDGDREEVYTYGLDGIFLGNNNLSEDDLMMADKHYEGWVNVYRDISGKTYTGEVIHESKERANLVRTEPLNGDYITTVKIEWEE